MTPSSFDPATGVVSYPGTSTFVDSGGSGSSSDGDTTEETRRKLEEARRFLADLTKPTGDSTPSEPPFENIEPPEEITATISLGPAGPETELTQITREQPTKPFINIPVPEVRPRLINIPVPEVTPRIQPRLDLEIGPPQEEFRPVTQTLSPEVIAEQKRLFADIKGPGEVAKIGIEGILTTAVPIGLEFTAGRFIGGVVGRSILSVSKRSVFAGKTALRGVQVTGGVSVTKEGKEVIESGDIVRGVGLIAGGVGFGKGFARFGRKTTTLFGIREQQAKLPEFKELKFKETFGRIEAVKEGDIPVSPTRVSAVENLNPRAAQIIQTHLQQKGDVLFGSAVSKTRPPRDLDIGSKNPLKSPRELAIKLKEAGVKDVVFRESKDGGKVFIGKPGERVKVEFKPIERLQQFPFTEKIIKEPSGLKRISEKEQAKRKLVGTLTREKDIADIPAILRRLEGPKVTGIKTNIKPIIPRGKPLQPINTIVKRPGIRKPTIAKEKSLIENARGLRSSLGRGVRGSRIPAGRPSIIPGGRPSLIGGARPSLIVAQPPSRIPGSRPSIIQGVKETASLIPTITQRSIIGPPQTPSVIPPGTPPSIIPPRGPPSIIPPKTPPTTIPPRKPPGAPPRISLLPRQKRKPVVSGKSFAVDFKGPLGRIRRERFRFSSRQAARNFAGYFVDVSPDTGFKVTETSDQINEPVLSNRVKPFTQRAKKFNMVGGFFTERKGSKKDSIGERVPGKVILSGGAGMLVTPKRNIRLLRKDFGKPKPIKNNPKNKRTKAKSFSGLGSKNKRRMI